MRCFVIFGFCFLLFSTHSWLNAAQPVWDYEENLVLKKDEIYQKSFQIAGVQKELKFYWTLYKNYGLVVNLKYDKFPYQFILYTDYARKSFKIPLSRAGDIRDIEVFLSFLKYDYESKEATLWLGVLYPQKIKSGS